MIATIFPKITQSLHENLTRYVHMFFSKFTSAHRKSYNSNHVPLRLIESCKKSLDQKMFVGVVPMDLVKSFRFYVAWPYCKDAHLRFFKELPCILLFILKKKKKESLNN